MLALGMLIVHDAFETRVGSREVALLLESEFNTVEFVVKFDTVLDDVEFVVGFGTALVTFASMVASGDLVESANVGRASTLLLEEEITTTSLSVYISVIEDVDATGRLTMLASDDKLVDEVTLEYGADGLVSTRKYEAIRLELDPTRIVRATATTERCNRRT